MKDKRISIDINKPTQVVFDFAINPQNTPKWIDSIVVEETNEQPPKLGTLYRNQNHDGVWTEYQMTAHETNKIFVLSKKDHPYHVQYTFTPLGSDQTRLEYYEWVETGELTDVFTLETLEKLKRVIERE